MLGLRSSSPELMTLVIARQVSKGNSWTTFAHKSAVKGIVGLVVTHKAQN